MKRLLQYSEHPQFLRKSPYYNNKCPPDLYSIEVLETSVVASELPLDLEKQNQSPKRLQERAKTSMMSTRVNVRNPD